MAAKNIYDAVNTAPQPLLLDGAIGSLIQQKGFRTDQYMWATRINLEKPDIIYNIHREYIKSGCSIITANTFRTNPIALKRGGFENDMKSIASESIAISRKCADKYNVFLAGSNAPAEDCYQKERTVFESDLIYNHQKHIDLLYSGGADFILNETQSHFDEIKIICEYCSSRNIPYCISLFFTEELLLLSGEPVAEVIEYVKAANPIAILFNCIGPNIFYKLIESINIDFNWGFYLNCGGGEYTDNIISCGLDSNKYSQIVKRSLNLKPKIIGACCGSNTDHIKGIRNLLNETLKS